MDHSNSIFAKGINPYYQAAIALGGVITFSVIAKLVQSIGILDVPQRFPWMAAASFMLLFAVFNSVFSLTSENLMRYWGKSVYSFLGLALGAGGFAYLFSSMSMSEAGSYRWIYIVVAIGYVVFLSMMATLRRIVEFAQREEWNRPRTRR